jgi:hypothetical protein
VQSFYVFEVRIQNISGSKEASFAAHEKNQVDSDCETENNKDPNQELIHFLPFHYQLSP